LDLSACPHLEYLDSSFNLLSSLYLKNGSIEASLYFDGNPNLGYICSDESQISSVQSIADSYNYTNCIVDAVCVLGNETFRNFNEIELYPNPVSNDLNIQKKSNLEISSISIYNTLGQLVIAIPNAQQVSKVDVSSLTTGNYFIKINSDKGTTNAKFAKN